MGTHLHLDHVVARPAVAVFRVEARRIWLPLAFRTDYSHTMTIEYVSPANESDARTVITMLKDASDLLLVSYGEFAVDLQLPDASSPHEVHLDASWAAGHLRLRFHMAADEAERRQRSIAADAGARGVSLHFERVPQ